MSLQSSFRKRWLGRHDTPRSPHKEHGPKGRQGAGEAAGIGKLQEGMVSIFSGKNQGATIFRQAPPTDGFGIYIAGDENKIKKGFYDFDVADTVGVWEGAAEDSFHVQVPERYGKVLIRAASAGAANNQDSVMVVYRGDQKLSKIGFKTAVNIQIHTPQGVIDLIQPTQKKALEARRYAIAVAGEATMHAQKVQVRFLERGKHY